LGYKYYLYPEARQACLWRAQEAWTGDGQERRRGILFLVEALLENRLDSRHRRACVWSINLDFDFAAVSSP
jgi:hypothetical protein